MSQDMVDAVARIYQRKSRGRTNHNWSLQKKKKGTDRYFYSLIFALKEGKKFNQSYKNKTKNKG